MHRFRPLSWPVAAAIVVALAVAIVAGVWAGDSAGKAVGEGVATKEIALFKVEGVRWILEQRDRHRPNASPLTENERRLFSGYFSEPVLDRARVLVLDRFENPGFFSVFDEAGLPYPMDLRRASGLALLDTILIARRADAASTRCTILFHELVHLAQYDLLGLELYMERYVDGWAESKRGYRAIPHERQAFELARRFARGSERFSVAEAVRAEFGL